MTWLLITGIGGREWKQALGSPHAQQVGVDSNVPGAAPNESPRNNNKQATTPHTTLTFTLHLTCAAEQLLSNGPEALVAFVDKHIKAGPTLAFP